MRLADELYAFPWLDYATNNANSYLIHASKKILVDPGHDHLFGALRSHLESLALSPEDLDLVLATHAHPDHAEALRHFSRLSVPICFPLPEFELLKSAAPGHEGGLAMLGFQPHLLLREGSLEVGDLVFQVYHTPGHSPGSVCLYWPEKKALFTGDVVFYGGIGRTDLPGGDSQELMKSIQRLSLLDVDFLLPGHGDLIQGRDEVRHNFQDIERSWFPYL
ncbi:MAG: MBL fold metallo-hydrolase [Thermodesulfobacteriota bacterium]